MRTAITTTALCLLGTLHAQGPLFQWARQWGATQQDVAYDVALDALGNTIVVGDHQGTLDGDPGAGVNTLPSAGGTDAFVAKLDAAGEHLWSYGFGSTLEDRALAVSTDPQGNVIVTGRFSGTVDFDPGVADVELTSVGDQDVFVVKLAADGTFQWARKVGSIYSDECYTVSVDAEGNAFVTGTLGEQADLDPGPGVYTLPTGNFLLKLDADGAFLWAVRPFTSGGTVFRTCTNAAGELFLTGVAGTGDFDPGPDTYTLTGAGPDIFVSKLDADGGLIWARLLGGPNGEQGNGIAVDANDRVYVTGWFRTGCNFDPGGSDTTLTTENGADAFVLRLNADGTFGWVFQHGGTTFSADEGYGVAVDDQGLVYITGQVLGTADMDPGPGTFLLSTGSTNAVFVQCVDSDAAFQWAFKVSAGAFAYNVGRSIRSDAQGHLRIAGSFEGANVDFDPGAGTYPMTVAGVYDAFVLALGPDLFEGIGAVVPGVNGPYPVPARERVDFGERVTGTIVDSRGVQVRTMVAEDRVSVAGWPQGLYVLRCTDGRAFRFLVE